PRWELLSEARRSGLGLGLRRLGRRRALRRLAAAGDLHLLAEGGLAAEAAELAVLLAVVEDALRHRGTDAGQQLQLLGAGGIDVDGAGAGGRRGGERGEQADDEQDAEGVAKGLVHGRSPC